METTEDPYDAAVAHLSEARKLLAAPAAQARTLAKSGSPHAQSGAEAARKETNRLRNKLLRTVTEIRALEEGLGKAQDWHDRYEYVNGRRPTP